jgi:6-phospho-3-hexuloisomerase
MKRAAQDAGRLGGTPSRTPITHVRRRNDPANGWRNESLLTVRDEVGGVLSAVSSDQMARAKTVLTTGGPRWFCSGQGRSGLVAQMVAMRLMHAGFDAHAVGEPTAPAIGAGDGLIMISGSGETPVSLHLARLALGAGARMLALTTRADSTLAGLADVVIEVPTQGTGQFGGTLFEQSALLLSDAIVLDLTGGDSRTYAEMQARHTNLQ